MSLLVLISSVEIRSLRLAVMARLLGPDLGGALLTPFASNMIMVEVWARDNHGLTDIVLQEIGKLEGVTRVCPAIVLERIK